MIVNNFYNYLKWVFADPNSVNTTSKTYGTVDNTISGITDKLGESVEMAFTSGATVNQSVANYGQRKNENIFYETIAEVGVGNTPATVYDYKLNSGVDIVSSSGHTTVRNAGENCTRVRYYIVVANSTSGLVTVKEIGIFKKIYRTQNNGTYIMISHSIIEPITLAAGETGTITYDIVL